MANLPYKYKGPRNVERRIPGLIIVLAGMQLTRKHLAGSIAQERGYAVVSTGDFIREYCIQQGLTLNYDNVAQVARQLTSRGETGLLERLKPRIEVLVKQSRGVMIDNLKSPAGVSYLKESFTNVVVIGFLASYDYRLEASIDRSRSDEVTSVEEFDSRDRREIEMGLAEVVIFADYFLLADTVERSREQILFILNSIETKWQGGHEEDESHDP